MSATATVKELLAAFQRMDPAAIVAVLDPGYLERWRRNQLFSVAVWCEDTSVSDAEDEWSIDQLDELLMRNARCEIPLLAGTSLGEVAGWSAAELMRRLLEAAVARTPKRHLSAGTDEPTVIGEVAETATISHVLCRTDSRDASSAIQVYTLRRDADAWKILVLPNEAEFYAPPEFPFGLRRDPPGSPAA